MLLIVKSKPDFVSIESYGPLEHRTQLKFTFASDQINLLIGDIIEDIGWDFNFLRLDIPINIVLFGLKNLLRCHNRGEHLCGDINLQGRSLLRKSVSDNRDVRSLFCGFVTNEYLEGLDDRLPPRRPRIEEVKTDNRHYKDLCLQYTLMHCRLSVLDEQSKHRHKVVITVIDYFYLNWSHPCHNLGLQLDLFDKFLKDQHNLGIRNIFFL